MEVSEHSEEVAGMPAFWRTAGAARDGVPALYLHGVPTSSDDWLPFLEASGGIAPDLPGFGRTGKPGYLPYDIATYAGWLEQFLDHVGVQRLSLVAHDWGAVGLAFAQRHPERIERLVIVNAVPFLPGYRWHRLARAWRTPVIGELVMGWTYKPIFRWRSREANVTPGPLPRDTIDAIFDHWDQGTMRAILRLYRSAPPEALALAGEGLGELRCPALVLWGEQDPYIGPEFADAYGERLPRAEVERIPGAGHWPWLDRPELVARIAAFLDG